MVLLGCRTEVVLICVFWQLSSYWRLEACSLRLDVNVVVVRESGQIGGDSARNQCRATLPGVEAAVRGMVRNFKPALHLPNTLQLAFGMNTLGIKKF